MKNESDGAQLREKLLKWSRTAAAWRQLQSKVDHGGTGTSESNPADLPPEVAKLPAPGRCDWAMQQLASARQAIAVAQNEQARAATLRDQLRNLQAEKQAKERARSRKLMVRFAMVALIPLAIVVLVGVRWLQTRPPRLSQSAMEESVTRALTARGLTATSMSFKVGSIQGTTVPILATFAAKLDQPLFTTIEPQPYLQQNFRLDPTVGREILKITQGRDGRRILELAGITSAPFDGQNVTLLKSAVAAGTSFNGTAMMRASKTSGGWQVFDPALNLSTLRADIKPRTAFRAPVFEVDREEDRARLRALVDEQPKVLAQLRQAQDKAASEILAQHKTEEVNLVKYFRVGAIFNGSLTGRTPKETNALYLEVTEAAGGSGTHDLKALAHNNGGWGDGRVFEGEWKFDGTKEHFALSLASRTDQAIGYGGPVLGDGRLLKLEVIFDVDRLTGDLSGSTCLFVRVPDGGEEDFRHSVSPDYFALRDAVNPGQMYLGSVKIAEGNVQHIILGLTQTKNGGALVSAVVEDPDREAWQYRYTGPLVGNHYRDGNWPIRLTVDRNSMPPGLPAKSFVLQFPALALRIENGTLLGDYRNQPFPFEPLSREELARRNQATAAWQSAFQAWSRPGGSLAGTTASPDGSTKNPVLLKVTSFNADTGAMVARLESGRDPAVFRNLTGKVFPDAGTINFDFDVRANQYKVDPRAPEPYFRSGRDNLILAVEGMQLTGHEGNNWTFAFRLGN